MEKKNKLSYETNYCMTYTGILKIKIAPYFYIKKHIFLINIYEIWNIKLKMFFYNFYRVKVFNNLYNS